MNEFNRLLEAIRDALEEMDKCPDDSVSDIFNEKFESWGLKLKMNNNYAIERE